jgi:hypothetical protein
MGLWYALIKIARPVQYPKDMTDCIFVACLFTENQLQNTTMRAFGLIIATDTMRRTVRKSILPTTMIWIIRIRVFWDSYNAALLAIYTDPSHFF